MVMVLVAGGLRFGFGHREAALVVAALSANISPPALRTNTLPLNRRM
jgi:hypothetical protein